MSISDAEFLDEGKRLGELVLRKVPRLTGVSRWQLQYRLNCILFFVKALKTFRVPGTPSKTAS